MIHLDYRGAVAVLRLDRGKVSAIDLELLNALRQRLDEVEASAANALVLTGSGANFSAGVNLHRVLEGGADYVERFLPALSATFARLFVYPLPVVAAVNGNAIAGGCVLVCCCDHRIMADGEGVIGLPVLRLGAPFPPTPIEILRFAIPNSRFQEIIYSGRTYGANEASAYGLIDEVVACDRLMERAHQVAGRLSEIPRDTFQITKRQLREPAMRRLASMGDAADEPVIKAWSDARFHARLRDHIG